MTGTCLTGRLILCPVGRAPVQKLQLSVLDSRRVTAVHKLADRLLARPFTPNQTFPATRNCESIQLFAMISFRIVEITCYATYIRFWAPKPDRFLVWPMHILRLTQLIFFSTNSNFRKFQAKKSNTKKGIWHFFATSSFHYTALLKMKNDPLHKPDFTVLSGQFVKSRSSNARTKRFYIFPTKWKSLAVILL